MNLQRIKELIDETIQLEYFENDGDLMSLELFIQEVNSHSIMDYDGFGYVIYKGKEISNAQVWVDEQLVIFFDDEDNAMAFSLELIEKIYGDDIEIAWYNR